MQNQYDKAFYSDRHARTVDSARTILALVFEALPRVETAIDVGCGVGTWLSVLKESGVSEVKGLDGPWVDTDLLEIDQADFEAVDLSGEIVHEKKCDLAISLEVAEHLPPDCADNFIATLTAASDFVLFSAAIPMQGGTGHLNEQWPDYWVDLYARQGFAVFDFIRVRIWNKGGIPLWYRQNTMLFVKEECVPVVDQNGFQKWDGKAPISIVHPDLFLKKHRLNRKKPRRS